MTLKEFSKDILSNETLNEPKWRRVFPIQLKQVEYYIRKEGLFRSAQTGYRTEEKWERIHKGDVIDTRWQTVPTDYIEDYSHYAY